MTEALRKIKAELESTYDIPFYVREEQMNGEPCFCMGPENDGQEFFYIRVSFRNGIRMTAEFIPEKYGAAFIRSMASRPEASKDTFIRYINLMQERGAKVTLSIDHTVVLPENFKNYRGRWNHFAVKATKAPIVDGDTFSYSAVAQEWGSLMMGMVLSLADIVVIDESESPEITGCKEGAKSQILTNKYERSRTNRKLCLEYQGYNCCVCNINFEDTYGEIGHNFIHVHHVVPVSQLGDGYIVDPAKDLVPVCPNCHAMLHKKNPPYLPEELRKILQARGRHSNYSGRGCLINQQKAGARRPNR